MICDLKQLKKLVAIQSKLTTIQNIIYFDDNETEIDSGLSGSLTVQSFTQVERLGQENPVPPSLSSKNGIAVIMYTSGSTGLPKVGYCSLVSFSFLSCN